MPVPMASCIGPGEFSIWGAALAVFQTQQFILFCTTLLIYVTLVVVIIVSNCLFI